MKVLFRLTHIYTLGDHLEKKFIGIYSSEENAENAIRSIKDKPGFREYSTGFSIRKQWYFIMPRLLDRTYWEDGFFSYKYSK